jgi:hypothetical protein
MIGPSATSFGSECCGSSGTLAFAGDDSQWSSKLTLEATLSMLSLRERMGASPGVDAASKLTTEPRVVDAEVRNIESSVVSDVVQATTICD